MATGRNKWFGMMQPDGKVLVQTVVQNGIALKPKVGDSIKVREKIVIGKYRMKDTEIVDVLPGHRSNGLTVTYQVKVANRALTRTLE